MDPFNTIEGGATGEYEEKKSRFIAALHHADTEAEALAFLARIREENPMARHNVYAYILREDNRVRYSDDGEPQKTAGIPVLSVLEHAGLKDVICVVTRYFGGVLLGAGGLTRAYSKSAKDALDAAGKARMTLWTRERVGVPYPLFERLTRLIDAHGGLAEGSEYGADVAVTLRLPQERAEPFAAALTELSGGGISPEILGTVFLPGARETT